MGAANGLRLGIEEGAGTGTAGGGAGLVANGSGIGGGGCVTVVAGSGMLIILVPPVGRVSDGKCQCRVSADRVERYPHKVNW
jgi:hypothetical protein